VCEFAGAALWLLAYDDEFVVVVCCSPCQGEECRVWRWLNFECDAGWWREGDCLVVVVVVVVCCE
jgi:hypothetical protein